MNRPQKDHIEEIYFLNGPDEGAIETFINNMTKSFNFVFFRPWTKNIFQTCLHMWYICQR